MKRGTIGLWWLVFLGFCHPVEAMDPFNVYKNDKVPLCSQHDLTKEMTLVEAMEVAVCESPMLKGAYLGTQVVVASYGQNLSSYFPTVTGTGSLSHSNTKIDGGDSSDNANASAGASLKWLLMDFGERSNSAKAFKNYVTSAYYGYDDTLQTMLYNVAESYYSVLSAEEKHEGLLKSEESSKKAFEEASSRFNLGLVPLSDKLQAETAYAQAQLASTVAKKNIKLKQGALANRLNLPPYTKLKLKRDEKTFSKEQPLEKIELLIETALAHRPDYKAKKQDLEASKYNVKVAKKGHLPSLNVVGSANMGKEIQYGDDGAYQSSVGVQLSIPLFSGFQQSYKVGQARFEQKQTEEQLNQLKIDVENDVWTAVQDYKTSRQTHEISQTLLKSAQESERVAFESYKIGKANILTLLDSQSQLASARIEYSTSFYNYLIAKNNLMRALGQMEKKN